MINAQAPGNRPGNKTVGGRNNHQVIAGSAVAVNQCLSLGQDERLNIIKHELPMPLGQSLNTGSTENFLAKILVGKHIQLSGEVIGVKLIIALPVLHSIHIVVIAQKLAPEMIAITSKQGVVQVKNC